MTRRRNRPFSQHKEQQTFTKAPCFWSFLWDGFTYVDPTRFHELFAADLPADQAAFMARSEVLNFADNFSATITDAAWRTKPSWVLVAGSDRTINPELQRWYAKRANSQVVEVLGASHAVYVSRPRKVAALIEEAASATAR